MNPISKKWGARSAREVKALQRATNDCKGVVKPKASGAVLKGVRVYLRLRSARRLRFRGVFREGRAGQVRDEQDLMSVRQGLAVLVKIRVELALRLTVKVREPTVVNLPHFDGRNRRRRQPQLGGRGDVVVRRFGGGLPCAGLGGHTGSQKSQAGAKDSDEKRRVGVSRFFHVS